MDNILSAFAEERAIRAAIKVNWENYHYCLGNSPQAELSVGRHLTWLMTDLPDHFMNLVVCTQLPSNGVEEIVDMALTRFRAMMIEKLSWLIRENIQSTELNNALLANGLTFRESFAAEMAIDLSQLPETFPTDPDLKIILVKDECTLRQWSHVASIGFQIGEKYEQIWQHLFMDAVFHPQYRTYLALLHGEPVGTSQLFNSEGVAGIYNVTVLPEARCQGIGSAITLVPLLEARKLGYRIGVLQASKRGYSVYRRLGFQDMGNLSLYLWKNESIKNQTDSQA
jgi:ribosomal protein S18 acetylase RimI-like enzyme